jgi:hypothetical protein
MNVGSMGVLRSILFMLHSLSVGVLFAESANVRSEAQYRDANTPFETIEEIRQYVASTKDEVRVCSEQIFSRSLGEPIGGDVLAYWHRIYTNISQHLHRALRSQQFHCVDVWNAFEELNTFFVELSGNQDFNEAVRFHSENTRDNIESDLFQRYVLRSHNSCETCLHLHGNTLRKKSTNAGFSVLNLLSVNALPEHMYADLICIQDAMTALDARTLYETLHPYYSHFIYQSPSLVTGKHFQKSILIASRYPLTNICCSQAGFLDFLLGEENAPLGHIYLAHAELDSSLQTETVPLEKIMEKIRDDISQNASIPVLLCGELEHSLLFSESMQRLLHAYFYPERADGAWLLKSSSHDFFQLRDHDYYIDTISMPVSNGELGLLSTIRPVSQGSVGLNCKSLRSTYLNKYNVLLCGGHAEASAGKDNEGNASFEGSLSFSERSESGIEYSGGVSVEVNRDRDGSVSTEGRVSGGISW